MCSYHKDWGKTIYRKNDDIYKEIEKEIIKVSTLNNGKAMWKQEIIVNNEASHINWQLIEKSKKYYEIYMQIPLIGLDEFVDQYKCRS